MAHGQASERLRELQELMDADNQALARDLEAGPSDTSPEPYSSPFRVSQSGGPPSWKDRLQALKVRAIERLSALAHCCHSQQSAASQGTEQFYTGKLE